MNKMRRETAVLRAGGFVSEEVAARAVNAEPWEPAPGMEKLRCPARAATSSPQLRHVLSRAVQAVPNEGRDGLKRADSP